jgi:FADH2 O2-dependent halogenase
MDNGITSVGLVEPEGNQSDSWDETIVRYPSLASLLGNARRVFPVHGYGAIHRMSRCRSQCVGPGWVSLPLTFGFVDPLHSSGIAHSLSGVVRVADALLSEDSLRQQLLDRYASDLRREIEWLDCLVSGCYAAQPSFQQFVAFASLYFMAAIGFEKQMAADPSDWPLGFLQCCDAAFAEQVRTLRKIINNLRKDCAVADRHFVSLVREGIEPWNHVGLLDPAMRHRIAHSAAPKYASIALKGKGDRDSNPNF